MLKNQFFISDMHFGHKNILSYDNRPFVDINEHDKFLISNWNRCVTSDDDVYILGDVSWHGVNKTAEILQSLKGNKHLIVGNHDGHILQSKEIRKLFVEIIAYKELKIGGQFIVLSHYPIPCFNKHYYGAYHFYGHVHNSFEEHMMQHIRMEMEDLYTVPCNMLNVGCMMPYMDFTPQKFNSLMDILVGGKS